MFKRKTRSTHREETSNKSNIGSRIGWKEREREREEERTRTFCYPLHSTADMKSKSKIDPCFYSRRTKGCSCFPKSLNKKNDLLNHRQVTLDATRKTNPGDIKRQAEYLFFCVSLMDLNVIHLSCYVPCLSCLWLTLTLSLSLCFFNTIFDWMDIKRGDKQLSAGKSVLSYTKRGL